MKKSKIFAFTIVSANYLSQAKVLANSLRFYHPEINFVVLLVDDESRIEKKEWFEIIPVKKIGVPDLDELLFKYNITEVNTAVKPFFIEYLFKINELEKLIFFDPDIKIYGRIDALLNELESNEAVLTPHITSPLKEDNLHPNEIEIMQVGTYNLGFIALKKTKNVSKFVSWWGERLSEYAISAPEKGLFTDQKWVDFLPSFIEKVKVFRDPGYNVAYWNLQERKITKEGEKYFVNNTPLVFFHFSGFNLENINRISRFQNRFSLDDFGKELKELFLDYKKSLILNDFLNTKKNTYAYAYFDNGVKIPDIVRKIYYAQKDKKQFGNPFKTKQKNSFFNWLKKNISNRSKISNLLKEVYLIRPDIQFRFPSLSQNESEILIWADSLKTEYGINKELFNPESPILFKEKLKQLAYSNIVFFEKDIIKKNLRRILGQTIYESFKHKYKLSKHKILSKKVKKNNYKIDQFFSDLNKKFSQKKYENSIVLFRPHGVGDLLMGLPAFKKLRSKYKNIKIIIYVYEESYLLMRMFNFFDEVIPLPRTFNYEQELYLLPLPKKSKFFNLMLEIEKTPWGNNLDNWANQINRNELFSKVLGVNDEYDLIKIPENRSAKEKIEKIMQNNDLANNKFVLITFESTNNLRAWNPAFYNEFLEKLLNENFKVVLVGKKQLDHSIIPNSINLINLLGKTEDITEIVELTKKARYIISTDTYLYHLAGILNKPFLGIFTGGINPDSRVKHYKRKVIVSAKNNCYCWDMGCKDEKLKGKEQCKVDLTPNKVFDKFIELTKKYK